MVYEKQSVNHKQSLKASPDKYEDSQVPCTQKRQGNGCEDHHQETNDVQDKELLVVKDFLGKAKWPAA